MVFLRVDLMTKFLIRHDPLFGPGLDFIEINILTKFHEDYIKTVPSKVYTWFLSRLRSRSETYVLLFRRRRRRRRRRRKHFCVKVIFSETIRARAMKLGSCKHLEELRSTLRSIMRLDLLFTVH